MADIDRYRPDDRRAVEALYRRVFGNDAAEASRLRWEWQYRRNPNNPGQEPEIWIAREGTTIVGQYATMPVRLSVRGHEVQGSWGMDVMVAPERQRQGLGEALFRTWDRNVGASLGARPSNCRDSHVASYSARSTTRDEGMDTVGVADVSAAIGRRCAGRRALRPAIRRTGDTTSGCCALSTPTPRQWAIAVLLVAVGGKSAAIFRLALKAVKQRKVTESR